MKGRIFPGLISLALAIGVSYWFFVAEPDVFLSTTSPDKTYTFELTGNAFSPSLPFYDHRTNFNLFKNNRSLVKNAQVMAYDFFDSGFSEMYSGHNWESESVLRFRTKDYRRRSRENSDSLTVSNKTSKNIKYLRITAGDMFFIFEMPPDSTDKHSVPQLGDLPWVMAEGEFADGRRIDWNGVNFLNRDRQRRQQNDSLGYCISVLDDGVKIESPQLDGFNRGGTSHKPNVPKAPDCDFH
ncbi:MAG: hypothetical protein M3384_01725 [Acidobacteriota bacterium]|nr:hypothetical protein [Acidobacteriota bacterium]